MKYVLFEAPDSRLTVRIFDDITSHNEIRAEVHSGKPGLKVVSAGKIWFSGAGRNCVHQSVSLGIPFDLAKSEWASKEITRLIEFSA